MRFKRKTVFQKMKTKTTTKANNPSPKLVAETSPNCDLLVKRTAIVKMPKKVIHKVGKKMRNASVHEDDN